MPAVAHWDRAEPSRRDGGEISSEWRDLSNAAGSVRLGMQLISIDPGMRSSPPHVHADSEEIFFVLEGDGHVWSDGASFPLAAGDGVVHRNREEAHTLRAGPGGIRVLACGPRPMNITWWPRIDAGRFGEGITPWDERPPWLRDEEDAGPLTWPDTSGERPSTVTALDDVPVERIERGESRLSVRNLGRAIGSVDTGMRVLDIDPGALGYPPHCHSAEEELFVVLRGGGTLVLGDERHDVGVGSVVARPSGTGVAHTFQAGAEGLRVLCYGERNGSDTTWYPRSQKIYFRGFDVMARVEAVGFWDGEE